LSEPSLCAVPGAATVTDEPVHLEVLGEFGLRVKQRPVAVRRAQQRLLAFLAVNRRPVSRGALGQRLWEGIDEQHGASALRSNLWRLPRPTGAPLVRTSGTHVALSDAVVVDLWHREQLAERLTRPRAAGSPPDPSEGAGQEAADPEPAEGSLEPHGLWADDLLPEWPDEWLLVERESYRQLRLHALEHLSRRLRGTGQHGPALQAALAAVQADPLRESAHRQVIAVHLAEGNPAEALRQFHVYRRLLAHELGLPPSPAIRELVAPLLGRPLERPRRRRP
jgi:DNA-binding SARP family transcriptional activator